MWWYVWNLDMMKTFQAKVEEEGNYVENREQGCFYCKKFYYGAPTRHFALLWVKIERLKGPWVHDAFHDFPIMIFLM